MSYFKEDLLKKSCVREKLFKWKNIRGLKLITVTITTHAYIT